MRTVAQAACPPSSPALLRALLRGLTTLASLGAAVVGPIAAPIACAPVARLCGGDLDCAGASACVDGACVDVGAAPSGPSTDAPAALRTFFPRAEFQPRVPAPGEPDEPDVPEPDEPAPDRAPSASCAELHAIDPAAPSGVYPIVGVGGDVVDVECDMDRDGGGWTVVARVEWDGGDDDSCPDGWAWTVFGCTAFDGAASALFPVAVAWSELRGEARAVSDGDSDAFEGAGGSIDAAYIDGVSITVGSPREHVWTFAAGEAELDSGGTQGPSETEPKNRLCPCAGGKPAPGFIDGAFSCESPFVVGFDTLWDGFLIDGICADAAESSPSFIALVDDVQEQARATIEARVLWDGGPIYVTDMALSVR